MRNTWAWLIGFTVMSGGLALLGMTVLVEIPFWILFGWIFFLQGVLPRVSVDLSEVSMALIAFVGGTVLLHYLFCSFLKNTPNVGEHSEIVFPVRWTLRKSLALSTMICCAFFSGISFVGTVHQTIWLAQSEMTESSFRDSARKSSSANQLKNNSLSVFDYNFLNKKFPAGSDRGEQGQWVGGWITQILPQMQYCSNENDD